MEETIGNILIFLEGMGREEEEGERVIGFLEKIGKERDNLRKAWEKIAK